jgi:hypothetical protein
MVKLRRELYQSEHKSRPTRPSNPNRGAYNRTAQPVEQHKMTQKWADYMDKPKVGEEIILINQST